MKKRKNESAVSIDISPDKVSAHVSETMVSRAGDAAAWLFPKKSARAKITAVAAHRISNKIESGAPLDEEDRYFIARMFDREARSLARTERAIEEVNRILPEVQEKLGSLPPVPHSSNETFVNRAERLAGEISDGEVFRLFARVLAGEVSRPGLFSLRTLDVLASLDQRVAQSFEALTHFACENEFVLKIGKLTDFLATRGFGHSELVEMEDAGLIADGSGFTLKPDQPMEFDYGGHGVQVTLKISKSTPKFPNSDFLTIFRFTRIGKDIASVLPFKFNQEYFDQLLAAIRLRIGAEGSLRWRETNSSPWVEVPFVAGDL